MKLCEIWATCSVLIAASASIITKARLANEGRSDHTPLTLSLAANVEPVNFTHVNVSIINTYSQQISILKWNNHFQTNQNSAYGSFRLTQRLSNGSFRTIGPGFHMGQFRHMDPGPSHYFNLTAGATYINCFDITQLFNIPNNGMYNLTMNFTRPAFLVPDGDQLDTVIRELKKRKRDNNQQSLPVVKVTSKTVSADFQATLSLPGAQKRGIQNTCASQAQTASVISKARGHARSLAKYAQEKVLPPLGIAAHGLVDDFLWKQYINNDSAARNVSSVYNAISTYGLNGQMAGITEFCDLNDTDHMCTDDGGAISYSTAGDGSNGPTLTFCRPFFTLPVAQTCLAPGYSNNVMSDQGGIYLHELAKCQELTKVVNVTDGVDDDCYNWDCVTSAAQKLNGEKAWLLAGAYELFAYAARADLSPKCPKPTAVGPQSQPDPPDGPPDEHRLPGVQQSVHGMPGGGLKDGGGIDTGGQGQGGMGSGSGGGSVSGGGSGGSVGGAGSGGTGG